MAQGHAPPMAELAGAPRRPVPRRRFDLSVRRRMSSSGRRATRLWRHELREQSIDRRVMIAANRRWGLAVERGQPFLFRVHQEPDPEALPVRESV